MGTSAGSGGTSGPATPAGAGGAATPAGAGGAATPAGSGGTTGGTGGTAGGGTSGAPEGAGGTSIREFSDKVQARKSVAEDVANPEADEFIARGKQEKKERIERQRAAALAEAETTEGEGEDGTGRSTRATEVNKGKRGDVASGGKRKGGKAIDETL
jgi:hypothetical protein